MYVRGTSIFTSRAPRVATIPDYYRNGLRKVICMETASIYLSIHLYIGFFKWVCV